MFVPEPFNKLKRGPQVVLPRDASLICAYAGICSGSRVLEAGSGSGWLTIFIARIVGKDGVVYSYEWRKDFLKIAKQNVKKLKIRNVVFKNADIYKSIDEKNLDAIVLDVPEPWKVLRHAYTTIKKDGRLVCYLPTFEQTKKIVESSKNLFEHELTFENIFREIVVKERASRPKSNGIMHTAFISVFRRCKHGRCNKQD